MIPMSWVPEYRPWAGFTVWLGLSAIAFVLVGNGTISGDTGGWVSLFGFLVAFAWSQGGIPLRPGERREVGDGSDGNGEV